jgi:hypothetical protein
MIVRPELVEMLDKITTACDGHPMDDILAVISSLISAMIDDLEMEIGVPIAISVALTAIQVAYDIEAEQINVSEYLQ